MGVYMKTKVLLVDDEKLERVLIHKGFQWEENGFEIIGEASHGEEALDIMKHKQPELVVTDISMPFMDGLELTEEILKQYPQCRVIVVTGYREFEYARRAVKLGVKDFLLKPVNIKDLEETITNVKKEIEEQKNIKKEYVKLQETVHEHHEIVIESFLQRLVEGRVEEEEAFSKLTLYGFDGILKRNRCINIKPIFFADTKEEEKLHLSREMLFAAKSIGSEDMVIFQHFLYNIILFIPSLEDMEEEAIAHKLLDSITKQNKLECIIGISEEQEGFQGILHSYTQSKKAISASVILGKNCVIPYREYRRMKRKSNSMGKFDWKEFIDSIANGMESKVSEYIDYYLEAMSEEGLFDTNYLKLSTMSMLMKASVVLTKYGKSLEDIIDQEDMYAKVSKIDSLWSMKQYLQESIGAIVDFNQTIRSKNGNNLINQVITYLEKHLYEQNLTLKRIAKDIYINESYLSRVFKKEMGESLIEYITRKRIEESMRLLDTTDLKVYEIAERVGISDPHYFSICFKKQLGIMVKEYKKQRA